MCLKKLKLIFELAFELEFELEKIIKILSLRAQSRTNEYYLDSARYDKVSTSLDMTEL